MHMVAGDEELAWITRSRRGDQEAFESLIRRYQRMVHSLAYRMTGSLTDTQDLAQETFIQAYQQLDTFRGEAKFSSWLYRIALNRCLNWRKRESRREQVHNTWTKEHEQPNDANPTLFLQVQEALAKLPPKQRAAIVLTVYQGLSHAEAAKLLECSETTVSWRLFIARAKLKKMLKGICKEGDAP
jgi:RNA polymerase sigma-70 factor (ECF subfamily)